MYHDMRNLSSWGIDQLEIFMQKSSFSKKMYLNDIRGVAESVIKLNMSNTSCLVHMNRKHTMKLSSWGMHQLELFMTIIIFF